jgi:hypothetical protein
MSASTLRLAPAPDPDVPSVALALRKVAKALDELGVLALHLADVAEHEAAEDPMLSAAEAAAELRCSESHIRNECARGRIAAMKTGGWFMRRSALRTYERRHTQGG